jgi:hypothetical protein
MNRTRTPDSNTTPTPGTETGTTTVPCDSGSDHDQTAGLTRADLAPLAALPTAEAALRLVLEL